MGLASADIDDDWFEVDDRVRAKSRRNNYKARYGEEIASHGNCDFGEEDYGAETAV